VKGTLFNVKIYSLSCNGTAQNSKICASCKALLRYLEKKNQRY
jgi:hypothetical protein